MSVSTRNAGKGGFEERKGNVHEITDDAEGEDGDGEDVGAVVRSTEHLGHALVAVFYEGRRTFSNCSGVAQVMVGRSGKFGILEWLPMLIACQKSHRRVLPTRRNPDTADTTTNLSASKDSLTADSPFLATVFQKTGLNTILAKHTHSHALLVSTYAPSPAVFEA